MSERIWTVYLSGEIHGDWRDRVASAVAAAGLPVRVDAPVCVHADSDEYRQWNAAFDAGMAAALGKAVITLHDAALDHALKEVDAAALAVCRTPEQVAQTLAYVIRGQLPGRESTLAAE